jgi:phosphoribosylamine---glycine ligase
VNCIIDDKGNPWPLEFTMRPGWPIFNIQQQLHRSTAQWMKSSLEGRSIRSNFLTDKIATGIVVSIPDYPYSFKSRAECSGIPIYGLEENQRWIHLCECKAGAAPTMVDKKVKTEPAVVTAGNYVLVTCGLGASVQDSRKKAYDVAESLIIPNSPAWRTDVGERLKSQLPQMQKMGYAKGMTF